MSEVLFNIKQVVKDAIESRYWPKRPQTLNFEITAACDARCIHCPRIDMDRPMRIMEESIFCKLVDQAAELGVPYLCPNGFGEICTIPVSTLSRYLEYITSRSWKFKIVINTNGNRMDEERSELFIKHKVHLINVTIDGAVKETAESIRLNLNFDRIEENIKRLVTMRRNSGGQRPQVRVGMIVMPQTLPEYGMFFERWHGIADHIGMGGFSSRLSSVEAKQDSSGSTSGIEMPKARKANRCVLPFQELNIWADGKAVLCCEDWNEEHVVGDLGTQSLIEIWRGEALSEVRKKHIAKRSCEVDLCAKCNNWHQPGFGAKLWV